ncbi:MAG: ferrochelatase [Sphingomonadaceae bacterium]
MKPADHPVIAAPKIGVLIVNLGTPDAPDVRSVRRYLAQFLSDRRVVELPQILWQPLLRGVVLRTRPKQSAHAYAQVWTPEGSPLEVFTRRQAEALASAFGDGVIVEYAMRYGSPAIPQRIEKLKDAGAERILIAPLYPQYSGATTATANDMVFKTLMDMRWQPALRTLPPYHDSPDYIAALKASIDETLSDLDFVPETILASFHSMPVSTLMNGDPYHCQCRKTARLLGEALGTPLAVSFQSKLGRAKWLEPSTEETLGRLAKEGVRRLAVVTPGFSADNLETLEEIAIRGRETFIEAGGTHFAAVPCLNASPAGIQMLQALLARELEGWLLTA